jgi:uncharacterized protein (DUF433 family)
MMVEIPERDVLEYLAGGMTEEQIIGNFPGLTKESIRAALQLPTMYLVNVTSVD